MYFSLSAKLSGNKPLPSPAISKCCLTAVPNTMELTPREGHRLHSHNPPAAQLGTPGNRAKLDCFSSPCVETEVCNGRCQYTLLLPEPPLVTILRAGIKALLTHYHILQARTGWEGQVCLNQCPACNFTATTLTRDCPLD